MAWRTLSGTAVRLDHSSGDECVEGFGKDGDESKARHASAAYVVAMLAFVGSVPPSRTGLSCSPGG